jgi:hypothetical protein
MALTSKSHLAITDVLCIPDRTGFSKYIIPATIQIIFAIPDELADKKKKKHSLPPCLSERARYSNHNVAVIVVNHHDDDIIRICCQLSMLIALKPLATVSNRPKKVHKARLQALQRYLGTRSDCEIAKVSCRIAVELI